MADIRENLGWLVGSVVAAIAAFLGWFYESGLFNTVLGIIIGAGIAFFVQTRTQKRVWKREYSIKIAETVYGPLYRQVKSVVSSLEQKQPTQISFEQWGQFQQDHKYFMVDEKFRAKLDGFFENVRKYSFDVQKLRTEVLPEIISEEVAKFFKILNVRPEEFAIEILYAEPEPHRAISTYPKIIECLISQTHPKDYVLKNTRQASKILSFKIGFGPPSRSPEHEHDAEKFDEFWESILERIKTDQDYQSLLEETDRLLEEAKSVKKEIVKRIEEPWKI